MRNRFSILILLALTTALPVAAQDFGRPLAQVALQPLPETETPDIEALLRANWRAYYNGSGDFAFFRDQVRAGRIDLNEDGQAELMILIDSPAWISDKGQPLLVARWTNHGWAVIGWSFGDSDGVFVTSQRSDGWASIETPSQWLRWNGSGYRPTDRPKR